MFWSLFQQGKPIRCKRCKVVLGRVVGDAVIVSGVAFRRNVTACCMNCGFDNKWAPITKKNESGDLTDGIVLDRFSITAVQT